MDLGFSALSTYCYEACLEIGFNTAKNQPSLKLVSWSSLQFQVLNNK